MQEGEKMYRLTLVQKKVGKSTFKCECGNTRQIEIYLVRSGNSKSCGCLRLERLREKLITHGMGSRKSENYPTYSSWQHMKDRCLNPNNKYYKNYGGRGITVCDRWMNFENFLEDMGVSKKGETVERIDNNKDYSKENCRWATFTEQMNNTSRTHWIEYEGRKQSMAEWAKEKGIAYDKLATRIKRGWPIEKALSNI